MDPQLPVTFTLSGSKEQYFIFGILMNFLEPFQGPTMSPGSHGYHPMNLHLYICVFQPVLFSKILSNMLPKFERLVKGLISQV